MIRTPLSLLTGLLLVLGLLVVPAAAQDVVIGAEVEVRDNFFEPAEATIAVGESVLWTWAGERNHNVISEDERFASPIQGTGETFTATFEEPGVYGYFCSLHANMDGTITVTEDGEPVQPGPIDPPVEPSPPVEPGPGPDPVPGDDPVETALAWSALLPDGGAATALVGTAGGFADSLASGVAQGAADGTATPLLLTDTDALDDRVAAEIARLGVTRVIVLGGVAAVSQAVEDELAGLVETVDRAAGDTRLETARAIADLVAPDATQVIVARAFGEGSAGFADSLGAGAASALTGSPIVLTPTESLDPALATWLTDRGVDQAVIAGGTAAISQQVEDDLAALGIAVTRYAGGTRFGTAAAIRAGLADLTAPATVVAGTTDLAWASGFAAALHSPGGILLSIPDGLPGDTTDALIGSAGVVCGPTIGDAACAQAQAAAAATEDGSLVAVMDDGQETSADTVVVGASGIARVLPAGPDALCAQFVLRDLSGAPVAGHIHDGGFGEAGPVLVDLAPQPVDGTTDRVACAAGLDPAVVTSILADPEGHYVNVHTALNPGGEVRGQLFAPSDADLEATLTGAAEVPDPGDPDVTGSFTLFDTGIADQLCYALDEGGLDPAAAAAHIHEGDAATAGPVVHALRATGPEGATAVSDFGCAREVDAALVAGIFADPAGYYANVHNSEFPAGAIRGQLDGSVG